MTASMIAPALPFTLAGRFQLASLPSAGAYTLFAFDVNASSNFTSYRVQVVTAGSLRVSVVNQQGNGVYAETATSSVSSGVVYSFAAVFAGTASRTIYLNTTKASNFASFSIAAPTRLIISGAQSGATVGQITNGIISETAVWDVALTDNEVASLAAGFTPDQIRPQSLQLYAPLVRDLVDVRGGRAIANANGATVATHPRVIT